MKTYELDHGISVTIKQRDGQYRATARRECKPGRKVKGAWVPCAPTAVRSLYAAMACTCTLTSKTTKDLCIKALAERLEAEAANPPGCGTYSLPDGLKVRVERIGEQHRATATRDGRSGEIAGEEKRSVSWSVLSLYDAMRRTTALSNDGEMDRTVRDLAERIDSGEARPDPATPPEPERVTLSQFPPRMQWRRIWDVLCGNHREGAYYRSDGAVIQCATDGEFTKNVRSTPFRRTIKETLDALLGASPTGVQVRSIADVMARIDELGPRRLSDAEIERATLSEIQPPRRETPAAQWTETAIPATPESPYLLWADETHALTLRRVGSGWQATAHRDWHLETHPEVSGQVRPSISGALANLPQWMTGNMKASVENFICNLLDAVEVGPLATTTTLVIPGRSEPLEISLRGGVKGRVWAIYGRRVAQGETERAALVALASSLGGSLKPSLVAVIEARNPAPTQVKVSVDPVTGQGEASGVKRSVAPTTRTISVAEQYDWIALACGEVEPSDRVVWTHGGIRLAFSVTGSGEEQTLRMIHLDTERAGKVEQTQYPRIKDALSYFSSCNPQATRAAIDALSAAIDALPDRPRLQRRVSPQEQLDILREAGALEVSVDGVTLSFDVTDSGRLRCRWTAGRKMGHVETVAHPTLDRSLSYFAEGNGDDTRRVIEEIRRRVKALDAKQATPRPPASSRKLGVAETLALILPHCDAEGVFTASDGARIRFAREGAQWLTSVALGGEDAGRRYVCGCASTDHMSVRRSLEYLAGYQSGYADIATRELIARIDAAG